ncbi:MAG: DNA recombination protein RmuC [Clostridiales bacterium]|nr:DNA recombination protein RmuC [Clostridiales bacterium]
MEIAVLIICAVVLVVVVIVAFLALRTFAGVHVLASRQCEQVDPGRMQEALARTVDQRAVVLQGAIDQRIGAMQGSMQENLGQAIDRRVASMEENLTRVEKDQQEMTRRFTGELSKGTDTLLTTRLDAMNTGITGVLKADKENSRAILESNQKVLTNGLDSLNKSMETRLTELTKTIREDFTALRTENTQQIEKIRETVNEKLDKTLNEQFEKSFKGVLTQMTELQKTMGELKGISNQVGSLEKTLNGVKTRGIAGEVQLKQIIADVLTPQQYAVEIATKPGSTEHVEIAIKMPVREGEGFVYLPIDSKCHLDLYETLLQTYDSGDSASIKSARSEFAAAVRKDAKDIAEKYISVPDTTPYAILFVPFEGMYSEIVNLNLLQELNQFNITVAGPYTLMAILSTVTNYFQALAIEQKSQDIERTLSAVKKEFSTYEKALSGLRTSLNAASRKLDDLQGRRTRAINRALRSVSVLDDGLLPAGLSDEEPDDELPEMPDECDDSGLPVD